MSDIDRIMDINYGEHQTVVSQTGMGSQENISRPLKEGGGTEIRDIEMGDNTPNVFLENLRKQNEDGIIIAHLNINFIYNKFEALKSLVENKIDVLVIAEAKIDGSFPSNQFLIGGFSTPFREDRNCHGGGYLFRCAKVFLARQYNVSNFGMLKGSL